MKSLNSFFSSISSKRTNWKTFYYDLAFMFALRFGWTQEEFESTDLTYVLELYKRLQKVKQPLQGQIR